jgi:hypothetical protein
MIPMIFLEIMSLFLVILLFMIMQFKWYVLLGSYINNKIDYPKYAAFCFKAFLSYFFLTLVNFLLFLIHNNQNLTTGICFFLLCMCVIYIIIKYYSKKSSFYADNNNQTKKDKKT